MKNVILCLLLLFVFSSNVEKANVNDEFEYTVLHLNAKWNKSNSLPIHNLNGCNLEWALLEEQPLIVQEKFSKIPVIALKKGNEPIRVWEGNIMFEPTVTIKEIQETLDELQ